MRRSLTVAALALSASVPLSSAHALPPDCERYGDKPCVVACEVVQESYVYVQMLVENAPEQPFC